MPPRLLYRLFPWVGRSSLWLERHLPAAGRLILGLFIVSLLFGIDFRQTMGYQTASLAFSLLLASFLLSVWWRPRLEVRRILPELATEGAPLAYYVEVTNRGRRAERDLVIQDCLANPPLDYEQFQRRRRRGRGRRVNVVDRAIGFPRWVELRRRNRGAQLDLVGVESVPPGATVRVRVDTTPVRRGWLNFERLLVMKPDPLGLFRASHVVRQHDHLLSLPQRFGVPRVELRSERHYQKGGVSLAHAVGDSQEFASLRDYRPGDPRRHIHWRSFAKTGELVVKEYQDEYFDRHALVIDTHIDPAEEAVFEAMISVGASLAAAERPQDSILDLIFLGTEVVQLSSGRGLGAAANALTYLAEACPAPSTDFHALAGLLREKADQLASLIVVFGTDDVRRQELFAELATYGVPCISLFVTDDNQATVDAPVSGNHRPCVIRTEHVREDLARVGMRT